MGRGRSSHPSLRLRAFVAPFYGAGMIQKFLRFAAVSGTGWLIDVVLTVLLVRFGATPFMASLTGSVVAVTFVYIVSLRAVFAIEGRLGARAFPLYVVWQVVSISASAALVAFLTHLTASSVAQVSQAVSWIDITDPLSTAAGISKGLATPVTLAANFLFFQWLAKWLGSRQEAVPK